MSSIVNLVLSQGTDDDCNTPIADCDTPTAGRSSSEAMLTESFSLIDSDESKRTLVEADSKIAIEIDIAMDESWVIWDLWYLKIMILREY